MPLLNRRETGAGGVPLLIVHGLFGSARNWGAIAKALGEQQHVVAVDLRNHGDSFRADEQSYEAMAADLSAVIDDLGGRADVLGHSMGGKAAMVLALQKPELLRRLIVADIAPTSYGHSQLGLVEAMQALDLKQVSRRSEADRVLQHSIPDAATRMFLLQSLVFQQGVATWRLNLDVLGAEMPKIMSFPKTEGSFSEPSLFLAGGASNYVRSEHHAFIRALFPAAEFVKLEGAGHWLHAEKPQQFVAAVQDFLGTGAD